MHSTIKQSYLAPSATHTGVAVTTLGIATLSGEPAAGLHVGG
jgi:hypothetical protein